MRNLIICSICQTSCTGFGCIKHFQQFIEFNTQRKTTGRPTGARCPPAEGVMSWRFPNVLYVRVCQCHSGDWFLGRCLCEKVGKQASKTSFERAREQELCCPMPVSVLDSMLVVRCSSTQLWAWHRIHEVISYALLGFNFDLQEDYWPEWIHFWL